MKYYRALIDSKNSNSYSINGIHGVVFIIQYLENSLIEYDIYGLEDGLHGFHIHEKPVSTTKRSKNPCDCTCGHYNPTNDVHGYHVGDLCYNIFSYNGRANGQFVYSRLKEHHDINNTSIVVHQDEDNKGAVNGHLDEQSLTSGKAGKRLACANLIRIKM